MDVLGFLIGVFVLIVGIRLIDEILGPKVKCERHIWRFDEKGKMFCRECNDRPVDSKKDE